MYSKKKREMKEGRREERKVGGKDWTEHRKKKGMRGM